MELHSQPPARPPRAPRHPRYDAIHRALLTGLLSSVGTRGDTHEYMGPQGMRFHIFPGSTLFGQKQRWVMSGEIVETTKLYARTCAGVEPQWIEQAAGHLVERSYSEPLWDSRTASAVASEKVTLHGLVLIPARTAPYAPINPRVSRELFIQHALVLGDFRTDGAFFRFNAQLVAEVELLEAKIRQRNLLADAATRYAFYDARVPQDVANGVQFEAWRRRAEQSDPRILHMTKADLLRADAPAITLENYPDRIADLGGGLQLPVAYHYSPGVAGDGLTLAVPLAALTQLRAERYEWLVPGMLEEKIAALLRALPGPLRRNFVPVPTWAKAAATALLADVSTEAVSLRVGLAAYLAKQTGVDIAADAFSDEGLEPHLRMAFQVMDDAGVVLGTSRDLPQLQRRFAARAATTFAGIQDRAFNRDHIVAWDFGDLPESLSVQRFKMTIAAYPTLVDQGDECALRLLPAKEVAEAAHGAGVRRLFRMEQRREFKALAGELPQIDQMALHYYTLGKTEMLREDLVGLIADRALFAVDAVPRAQAAYAALKVAALSRLTETVQVVTRLAAEILGQYHALSLFLEQANPGLRVVAADVRGQLAAILPAHFLAETPWEWLEQIPRYLAAMRLRLDKISAGGAEVAERDRAGREALAPWLARYVERKARHQALALRDPELLRLRWMMEEYRVSLFAQELGTLMPVSPQRLEKQWEKTRKSV